MLYALQCLSTSSIMKWLCAALYSVLCLRWQNVCPHSRSYKFGTSRAFVSPSISMLLFWGRGVPVNMSCIIRPPLFIAVDMYLNGYSWLIGSEDCHHWQLYPLALGGHVFHQLSWMLRAVCLRSLPSLCRQCSVLVWIKLCLKCCALNCY